MSDAIELLTLIYVNLPEGFVLSYVVMQLALRWSFLRSKRRSP